MPRRSAASLSVIPLPPRPHPEPPRELTPRQAAIWRTMTECRPPEYFDRACWALLVQYCRHVDAANVIAGLIERCDPEDEGRYNYLLGMAVRQSNVCSTLSAKLRLAPQHVRRVDQVVKTSAKLPPWKTIP